MNSYMSVMAFANSLMLDFRCVIIPRFVYATGQAFDGEKLKDVKVSKRIEEAVGELMRFGQALRG
jgi:FMN reductase